MKKLKKNMLFYFACFCLIILTNANALAQEEYFEGIIEYSLEYDINNPEFSEERIKEYLGSKVITKFSKGSFRDEYYNNQGVLVRTSVLNLAKKQYYLKHNGIDTIYYTSINETDYVTTIQQLPDTNIDENDCWVIKSISVLKNQDKASEPIISKYYESKELKIDPNWFVDYIDGGYDRITKLAPGITLKTETFFPNFNIIESFVSKSEQKIDPAEFEFDSNMTLKKMN